MSAARTLPIKVETEPCIALLKEYARRIRALMRDARAAAQARIPGTPNRYSTIVLKNLHVEFSGLFNALKDLRRHASQLINSANLAPLGRVELKLRLDELERLQEACRTLLDDLNAI